MWSYFGSKSKIVNYYPEPRYDLIMEPFAGSGRYALKWFERQVHLNDINPVIYNMWDYVINTSTIEMIENLPELKYQDYIKDVEGLSQVERDLMGYFACRGVASPAKRVSSWAADGNEIRKGKDRILKYKPKIQHWVLTSVDYKELPDVEATWFIDPPYQHNIGKYVYNDMNYEELADWCKSRKGQVIVCENSKADWLDFRYLAEYRGSKKQSVEVIWTND